MNIRVKDILEEHRIDVFIGTLKDNIQHEVCLWEPDSLEKAFRLARKMERKIMTIFPRSPIWNVIRESTKTLTSLDHIFENIANQDMKFFHAVHHDFGSNVF